MSKKTRDGLKLIELVKMMSKLPIVSIRHGTKHPYIATAPGMRACPIAYSTDVRKMVVPWVQELTGYKAKTVYESLRTGKWH